MINEENGAIYVEAGDELTLEYDKHGEVTGGTVQELIEEENYLLQRCFIPLVWTKKRLWIHTIMLWNTKFLKIIVG
jgi:hypothetical protein